MLMALSLSLALQISGAGPVTWTDGDTGRLAGGEKFRLHGVDAPETGGARCLAERMLAERATEVARALTAGARIEVSRFHYVDRYGRQVVDLSADGRDVADALVASGVAGVWDYDGRKARPDWCGPLTGHSK